jgi:ABC-type dipeptide/oligopeptide/nickel transport system ATPase component
MQSWNTVNANSNPLLRISDLSVNFGEGEDRFQAVKGLSLEVHPGEIVGLIGESGSGKTTSAHAILGLIDGLPGVYSGEAYFNAHPILPVSSDYVRIKKGKVIKKDSAYRKKQKFLLKAVLGRDVAAIFQEPKSALNPFFSIKEHLLESINRSQLQVKDPIKYGQEMLTQVGIIDGDKVWEQYPHHLSGGMAQRVMVAMSICCNPKLIIADEPTTALDVTTQAKMLEFFLKLKEDRSLSILLITHDIGVVHTVANRVYVMYKGKIVESGATSNILHNPQHEYTQRLLSSFNKLGDRRIRMRDKR